MGSPHGRPETSRFDLSDLAATERLGSALAARLKKGDVVALRGGLGSGKTTLARAIIRTLSGPDEEVPSPTFTLVQTYQGENESGPLEIWHFDLYRLKHAEEAYDLAIEDAFAVGVSLIEWPDRITELLPRDHLTVEIEIVNGGPQRRVELKGGANWIDRLAAIAGDMT